MVLLSRRFNYMNTRRSAPKGCAKRASYNTITTTAPAFQYNKRRSEDPRMSHLHDDGLDCSPFARRYLGNVIHQFRNQPPRKEFGCEVNAYFLFHQVLRCFTSLGSQRHAMCSRAANMACSMLGCPIRKSPDQRLFTTSPRLIAGYDVLHRHILSSHPPYALKMLYYHIKYSKFMDNMPPDRRHAY